MSLSWIHENHLSTGLQKVASTGSPCSWRMGNAFEKKSREPQRGNFENKERHTPISPLWKTSVVLVACVAGVIGEGEGERGRREKMRGIFFSPSSLPFPFPDYAGHAGYCLGGMTFSIFDLSAPRTLRFLVRRLHHLFIGDSRQHNSKVHVALYVSNNFTAERPWIIRSISVLQSSSYSC